MDRTHDTTSSPSTTIPEGTSSSGNHASSSHADSRRRRIPSQRKANMSRPNMITEAATPVEPSTSQPSTFDANPQPAQTRFSLYSPPLFTLLPTTSSSPSDSIDHLPVRRFPVTLLDITVEKDQVTPPSLPTTQLLLSLPCSDSAEPLAMPLPLVAPPNCTLALEDFTTLHTLTLTQPPSGPLPSPLPLLVPLPAAHSRLSLSLYPAIYATQHAVVYAPPSLALPQIYGTTPIRSFTLHTRVLQVPLPLAPLLDPAVNAPAAPPRPSAPASHQLLLDVACGLLLLCPPASERPLRQLLDAVANARAALLALPSHLDDDAHDADPSAASLLALDADADADADAEGAPAPLHSPAPPVPARALSRGASLAAQHTVGSVASAGSLAHLHPLPLGSVGSVPVHSFARGGRNSENPADIPGILRPLPLGTPSSPFLSPLPIGTPLTAASTSSSLLTPASPALSRAQALATSRSSAFAAVLDAYTRLYAHCAVHDVSCLPLSALDAIAPASTPFARKVQLRFVPAAEPFIVLPLPAPPPTDEDDDATFTSTAGVATPVRPARAASAHTPDDARRPSSSSSSPSHDRPRSPGCVCRPRCLCAPPASPAPPARTHRKHKPAPLTPPAADALPSPAPPSPASSAASLHDVFDAHASLPASEPQPCPPPTPRRPSAAPAPAVACRCASGCLCWQRSLLVTLAPDARVLPLPLSAASITVALPPSVPLTLFLRQLTAANPSAHVLPQVSDLVPKWLPDDASEHCLCCNRAFGLFVRKHHCRSCGTLTCSPCSSRLAVLPALGYTEPVRVCQPCFLAISKLRVVAQEEEDFPDLRDASTPSVAAGMQLRSSGSWVSPFELPQAADADANANTAPGVSGPASSAADVPRQRHSLVSADGQRTTSVSIGAGDVPADVAPQVPLQVHVETLAPAPAPAQAAASAESSAAATSAPAADAELGSNSNAASPTEPTSPSSPAPAPAPAPAQALIDAAASWSVARTTPSVDAPPGALPAVVPVPAAAEPVPAPVFPSAEDSRAASVFSSAFMDSDSPPLLALTPAGDWAAVPCAPASHYYDCYGFPLPLPQALLSSVAKALYRRVGTLVQQANAVNERHLDYARSGRPAADPAPDCIPLDTLLGEVARAHRLCNAQAQKQALAASAQAELSLAGRWNRYLCLHPHFDRTHHGLRGLVKEGLPAALRAEVWVLLLESNLLKGHYQARLGAEPHPEPPSEQQILLRWGARDRTGSDAPSRLSVASETEADLDPSTPAPAPAPSSSAALPALSTSMLASARILHAAAVAAAARPRSYYSVLLLSSALGASNATVQEIDKDVRRTMCANMLYRPGGDGADALRRILLAFAVHNPAVAYCQSMNLLAGVLLCVLRSEEKAFWALTCLVEGVLQTALAVPVPEAALAGAAEETHLDHLRLAVHSHAHAHAHAQDSDEADGDADMMHMAPLSPPPRVRVCYHQHDLLGARVDCLVLSALVHARLPRAHAALHRLGLSVSELCVAWLLSLYIDILPTPTLFLVWDLLLLDGPRLLLRVALALLKRQEHAIAEATDVSAIMAAFDMSAVTPAQLQAALPSSTCSLALDQFTDMRVAAYKKLVAAEAAHKEAAAASAAQKTHGAKAFGEAVAIVHADAQATVAAADGAEADADAALAAPTSPSSSSSLSPTALSPDASGSALSPTSFTAVATLAEVRALAGSAVPLLVARSRMSLAARDAAVRARNRGLSVSVTEPEPEAHDDEIDDEIRLEMPEEEKTSSSTISDDMDDTTSRASFNHASVLVALSTPRIIVSTPSAPSPAVLPQTIEGGFVQSLDDTSE